MAGDSALIAMSTSNRIAYLGSCSKVRSSPNSIALSKSFVGMGWSPPRTRRIGVESKTLSPTAATTSMMESARLASRTNPRKIHRLDDTGLSVMQNGLCARSSANFVRTQIRGNFNRRIKIGNDFPSLVTGKDQHSIDLEHANPMDKADEHGDACQQ